MAKKTKIPVKRPAPLTDERIDEILEDLRPLRWRYAKQALKIVRGRLNPDKYLERIVLTDFIGDVSYEAALAVATQDNADVIKTIEKGIRASGNRRTRGKSKGKIKAPRQIKARL